METNLEKAKRLIKDNAAIQGIDLPNDGFIFKMLELAATPNVVNKISSNSMLADSLPADSEAKSILKELIEMYMVNVDSEGEPKASMLDMVELWQKASKIIEG